MKTTKSDDGASLTTSDSVLVYGNGPSLRGFDFKSAQGVDSIGMNAAYRHWERIGWYPDHYVCLDDQLIETHADAIFDLIANGKVRTAFLIAKILDYHPSLIDRPNVYYLESFNRTRQSRVAGRGIRFVNSSAFRESDPSKVTTGAYAVRFAAFLGYQRIGIMGVDLRYVEVIPEARSTGGIKLEITTTPTSNPNYFFDDYQRAGDKFNIPNPAAHGGNLHAAAFEVLAQDAVRFDWTARVFNCNPQSILHDRAIFPFVPIEEFLPARALAAVVVPATVRELEALKLNLQVWDLAALAPLRGRCSTPKPDLIFAFSGADEPEVREQLHAAFAATTLVKEAFARLEVVFLDLRPEVDVYIRDYRSPAPEAGYKAGPNEQFFATLEKVRPTGRFVFYMEADCIPLRAGWLEALQEVAESDREAWVIGSVYKGREPISPGFAQHLNGNALYRTGSPEFLEFARSYWHSLLADCIAVQDKRLAYDCVLSQQLSRASPPLDNEPWAVFQAIAHRLRATSAIANVSGSVDRRREPGAAARDVLGMHSAAYLVHGGHFMHHVHQWLRSQPQSGTGKASPPRASPWFDGDATCPERGAPWLEAVRAHPPRLLVVDRTAIGSDTATGRVKETFIADWPRERLAQVFDTTGSLAIDLPAADAGRNHLKGDVDTVLKACIAFSPEVLYLRLDDSLRILAFADRLTAAVDTPIVLHMMDDWPNRLRQQRPDEYPRAVATLKRLIGASAVRLSISNAMSNAYRQRHGVEFIPLANGVDVSALPAADHTTPIAFSPDRPFTIRYMGGLARDMTSGSVMEVARAVSELSRGIPVLLEIYTMDWYLEAARAGVAGLDGVKVNPLVAAAKYPQLLASADALLIAYNFDDESMAYVGLSLANKLPECLASGVPIIAYGPRQMPTIDYLDQAQCAMLVTQRSLADLQACIQSLMQSPDLRRQLGERGRSLALQRHDRAAVVEAFRAHVRRASRARPRPLHGSVSHNPVPIGSIAPKLVPTGAREMASDAAKLSRWLENPPASPDLKEANRLMRENQFGVALTHYAELYRRTPLSMYLQNAQLAARRAGLDPDLVVRRLREPVADTTPRL